MAQNTKKKDTLSERDEGSSSQQYDNLTKATVGKTFRPAPHADEASPCPRNCPLSCSTVPSCPSILPDPHLARSTLSPPLKAEKGAKRQRRSSTTPTGMHQRTLPLRPSLVPKGLDNTRRCNSGGKTSSSAAATPKRSFAPTAALHRFVERAPSSYSSCRGSFLSGNALSRSAVSSPQRRKGSSQRRVDRYNMAQANSLLSEHLSPLPPSVRTHLTFSESPGQLGSPSRHRSTPLGSSLLDAARLHCSGGTLRGEAASSSQGLSTSPVAHRQNRLTGGPFVGHASSGYRHLHESAESRQGA